MIYLDNPYKTRYFDEETVRSRLDRLTTLEVSFPKSGDDDFHQALLARVEPSAWRDGPNGLNVASFKLHGSTKKEELVAFVMEAQVFLNCRVTEQFYIMRDEDGIKLEKLRSALSGCRKLFPARRAPRKLDSFQLIFKLMGSLLRDVHGKSPIFDASGNEMPREIWEDYDDVVVSGENVYSSYHYGKKLTGVAFPAELMGLGGCPPVPSAVLKKKSGEKYVAYSLSGTQRQIQAARKHVAELLGEPGNKDAGAIFPLPVGEWRLDLKTAEKLEFDEPLRISPATYFLRR